MKIPFVDLAEQQQRIRADLDRRISQVLDHGAYINGLEVADLEGTLAAFAGCHHAIGVPSGTDVLLAALMAKGIGRGDAVFLPSFTSTATAEVVLQCGAAPVFVEVDAATFNLLPYHLHEAIVQTAKMGQFRPAASLAVDLFGQPADYQAINGLASEHDLFVLADGAQSFGASYHNLKVGSLAEATATSFYTAKSLGCYGDDGAIFTNDDELAAARILLRDHGQGEGRYDIVRLGLNARLDIMQAAVLLSKLTIFEDEIRLRRSVARHYTRRLSGLVETPVQMKYTNSNWAQYTIKLPNRDAVADSLRQKSIPTQIYYPLPMHLQLAYAHHGGNKGSLSVSEQLIREVLAFPMHPYLDETTTNMICGALREAMPANQSNSQLIGGA